MEKLFILFSILFVFGCKMPSENSDIDFSLPKEPITTNSFGRFDIIEIDSCEYVASNIGFNSAVLTHKGNCRFCESRLKK
jgi:hypothetical protein